MRRTVATLSILTITALVGLSHPASSKAAAMVFDAEIGHYKDISYEALSDEGLSWEELTRIFGGETVHYGELTGAQRKAKHKELGELLAKIDMKLVNQCQADVRAWLDKLAASPLKHEGWEKDWKKNWSVYTKVSKAHLEFSSAILFRAYEIWGDEKYLKAGLKRADVFVRDQLPRGNWRTNVARIQDGWQSGPFRTVLYAYKVSGDRKYFKSAKKCADCLLPLQRSSGGSTAPGRVRAGSSTACLTTMARPPICFE